MNFRMGGANARGSKRGNAGTKRAGQRRCYLGFLNVRSMRNHRTINGTGELQTRGEEKLEFYKTMMADRGLYLHVFEIPSRSHNLHADGYSIVERIN